MVSTSIGVWLGALLTIGIASIAIKENKFSRWAEYTLLSAIAGNFIVLGIQNINKIAINGLRNGDFTYIITLILGLMVYGLVTQSYSWIARIPVSLIVGVGTGVAVRAVFEADVIPMIIAGAALDFSTILATIATIISITLTLSTLLYFIFTFPIVQNKKVSSFLLYGRYGMIIAFGIAIGMTVMTRINQFAGRLMFLLIEWLGVAS